MQYHAYSEGIISMVTCCVDFGSKVPVSETRDQATPDARNHETRDQATPDARLRTVTLQLKEHLTKTFNVF